MIGHTEIKMRLCTTAQISAQIQEFDPYISILKRKGDGLDLDPAKNCQKVARSLSLGPCKLGGTGKEG